MSPGKASASDDEAFLDGLPWSTTLTRRYCDRCEHQAPTIVVGHIEGGSGPGYDIRHCRGCVGLYVARGRLQAQRSGARFVPELPRRGD